jgi:glycosyltransferase involved in cell wall biosynthesis
MGPLRDENVIIFSSDDWSSGLKTSKYHIARQLARGNRVLFVNSIGLRSPGANPRDLKRILSKLAAFFKGAKRVPEGLHVYTPIAIPFKRGSPLVRALNGLLLRTSLRWLKLRLGLAHPVVFVFIPTFNDVVGRLGEKAIIYYCIDDLRGYAGVDVDWFNRQEEQLLARSDAVISSARELHETFAAKGAPAHYVPHGVDWMLFRGAVERPLPEPADLRGIPHPRLGFYGFLSEEWVDYPLLKRMAAERPDWHIILIGRPSAGMDMASLIPEANIHYLGLKPFEELPAYTRHFDAGLVPFCRNHLTLHSNPLKLLEYLAGGLPVVSTEIPEVRNYSESVRIAGTPEEFIAACGQALAENSPAEREARSRYAEAHSWERRMETISDIARACIEKRKKTA